LTRRNNYNLIRTKLNIILVLGPFMPSSQEMDRG